MSLQMWFGLLEELSTVYICEQITHTIMDIFLFALIFNALWEPLNPLVLSDFLIYDSENKKIQVQLFVLERKNEYLRDAKLKLLLVKEDEQHLNEKPLLQPEICFGLLRGMVQTTFDITDDITDDDKKKIEQNSDYHFELRLTGTNKNGCPIYTKKTYSKTYREADSKELSKKDAYRFKMDKGITLHEYAYYNTVMIDESENKSSELFYSEKCEPREVNGSRWGWWWTVKNYLLTYRYYGLHKKRMQE